MKPDVCVFLPMYMENTPALGYQETAIHRVLRNLQEHEIPLVLVGDSKYNYFPGTENYSTDGSREVVESFNNTLLFDKGQFTEHTDDQHTYAFKMAAHFGFKWLLVLGCDEYITGDVNQLIDVANKGLDTNNPLFNIKFKEHSPDIQFIDKAKIGFVQRLFAYPGEIITKFTHWTRYYKGVRMVADQSIWLDQIVINHDSHIRPRERDEKMKEYQIKCIEHEDTKVRHFL